MSFNSLCVFLEVAQEIQEIEYTHSDDENLREVIEMCARAGTTCTHCKYVCSEICSGVQVSGTKICLVHLYHATKQSIACIEDLTVLSTVQPVLHVIPNVMVTIGRYGVLMCRSSTTDTPFQIAGSDIHVSCSSAKPSSRLLAVMCA